MLPAQRLMAAYAALAGVAAVLTGSRLHRPAHRWPWRVLAAGLFTFIAGDTYYNVVEEYFDASNPHNRSVQLLVVGTRKLLGFAILYGMLRLNDSWQTGTILDAGWIVFAYSSLLAFLALPTELKNRLKTGRRGHRPADRDPDPAVRTLPAAAEELRRR